jgi:hypothetical protein
VAGAMVAVSVGGNSCGMHFRNLEVRPLGCVLFATAKPQRDGRERWVMG